MSYNLENLFDTQHDKGKKDYTYLPLRVKQSSKEIQAYCNGLSNEYYRKNCLELDWSDRVLEQKINNLSQVIKAFDHKKGADIVVFQEVENINALTLLRNKGLKGLGYRHLVLVEGPDSRGIDVAIMSRYPLIKQKYHQVSMKPYSSRTTRGILEATFNVDGKKVAVLANHWPSQANPDETRMNAAEVLIKNAQKIKADLVVATGDFNTVEDDVLNPLKLRMKYYFEDVEDKGRRATKISAPGTHWYKGKWESLDKVFVLKKSLKKVSVDYSSFNIVHQAFMLRDLEWTDWDTGDVHFDRDVPHRFDTETGEGFSDHLPVGIRFLL